MSAQLDTTATEIPGCHWLHWPLIADTRGHFQKILHTGHLDTAGLASQFQEAYYTQSRRHVVRGLHFQRPPHHHDKIVLCLAGSIQDVVLDLRPHSPCYGQHRSFTLTAGSPHQQLYIPAGCAHGFCTLSEEATLLYLVTQSYAPEHDTGVRWDSAGIAWATDTPVLSERDRSLPSLAETLARQDFD